MSDADKKTTNEKPIPPIRLPFYEVIGDVLKIKPPPHAQAGLNVLAVVRESRSLARPSASSR